MKIYKEQKKPENPNPNNVIEENTELSRNISINLTEEIDNFVKSQRKISAKEIADYRLLNSQNILFDKIKYRKSESPDVSIIFTFCYFKSITSCFHYSISSRMFY